MSNSSEACYEGLLGEVVLPGDPLCFRPSGREAPCEERLRGHIEVLEHVARAEPYNFWGAVGEICSKDYWAFLRFILQYRWCDPWWHGEEICGFLVATMGKNRAVFLPRDTGKTTVVTIPYPAWALTRSSLTLTMQTNATEVKAMSMCRSTAGIIARNKRFEKAWPHIKPSKDKWGKGGYVIDGALATGDFSVERVDSSFQPYSPGGNLTGAHVDIAFHDDLINIKNYKFPGEVKKAESFLIESFTCAKQHLLCATRWSFIDCYGGVIDGEVVPKHGGPFEIMKRGIFNKDGEVVWKKRTYFDIQGNKLESGFTREEILALKGTYESRGEKGLFNALYLNDPAPEDDVEFEIELVNRYYDRKFPLAGNPGVGIEAEAQGALWPGVVRSKMAEEGISFKLDELKSGRVKKEPRIRAVLGPIIAEGRFHIPEALWRMDGGLGEQIRIFPAGHNDLLDACAYAAMNAKKPRPGVPPTPYIAVDPAASEADYSDDTAIVVACWYNDDFYVIDAKKFRTKSADKIMRMLFRLQQLYAQGQAERVRRQRQPMGVTTSRHPGFRGNNYRNYKSQNFEVDFSGYLNLGSKKDGGSL